jgi:hypothetical protein
MDKRWYPLAFSISVAGCGGNVDDGRPFATGGAPQYHYGPAFISGGTTSIDAGKPMGTGGMTPVPYYGVMLSTGGAASSGSDAGVGSSVNTHPSSSGGSTPIDAGSPSTGGYHPIPIYMANLRLPPQDDKARSAKEYFARVFEPSANAKNGWQG